MGCSTLSESVLCLTTIKVMHLCVCICLDKRLGSNDLPRDCKKRVGYYDALDLVEPTLAQIYQHLSEPPFSSIQDIHVGMRRGERARATEQVLVKKTRQNG